MVARSSLGLKSVVPAAPAHEEGFAGEREREAGRDRSIGAFLRQACALSEAQVDEIVAYQSSHGLRFGDAAVALRMASGDDVLWALSQQFDYAYPARPGAGFHAELVAAVDPFGAQTESLRGIRSQLMLAASSVQRPRRALAVLSPDAGDGKSFLAANLAVLFSQLGMPTLLVDADMRTPRQHTLFGISNEHGLSTLLAGRAGLAGVIHKLQALPSLFVLPVGTLPPNPLDLIERPSFAQLLEQLLARFERVIVDTPSSAHGADSRVLAAKCGAALIVGRRGTTRMTALSGLVADVTRAPCDVAGVVINEH